MKKMTGVLLILILTFSCTLPGKKEYPAYVGYVNDFAGIISQDYSIRMETLAKEVKQKSGVEIAVVTVKDMGGWEVEEYAVGLFEEWEIGKKGDDYGVLLLLALKERKIRIEVGYGLEHIITDAESGAIIRHDMAKEFTDGHYGRGFYYGLIKIVGMISQEEQFEPLKSLIGDSGSVSSKEANGADSSVRSRKSSRVGGIFFIIVMIFLMIVTKGRILPWILLGMMAGGGGRRGGFGGGSFGGGFGGFGGGMSGGGGASGSF